jgi:hypothetical protein
MYFTYPINGGSNAYVNTLTRAAGQYTIDSSQFPEAAATGVYAFYWSVSATAYLTQSVNPSPAAQWSPPYPVTANYAMVPDADPTPLIAGQVTDRTTRLPLSHVAIGTSACFSQSGCAPAGFTDANGNYAITAAELNGMGAGTLYFQGTGYYYNAQPFTATAATATLNVTLLPGGAVASGTVTDATSGIGIVGASVLNFTYPINGGSNANVNTLTTAGGQYALDSSQFPEAAASGVYAFYSSVSATAYVTQSANPSPTVQWLPPYPATANYALVGTGQTSSITVATTPAGLAITVDGVAAVAPQTYIWIPGNEHVIATATPQLDAANVSVPFIQWSDGGALSHTVVTPVSNATLTATFDATPPVISPQISGTLGRNGWYTSNVSLSWSVSDPLAPVTSTSGCASATLSTDTTGQAYTCTATGLGGSASQTVTLKRDATPPVVTATPAPLPNGNGWNNSTVTVSFSGTDAISGIASCASPVYLTAQARGQSASGSCTDNASNVGTATTATSINIDETPPQGNYTVTPGANAQGWNDSPVTVQFTATDSLSGVSATPCSPVSIQLGSDGSDQLASSTCSDLAGNTSIVSSRPINIDTAPPTAVATISPAPNANGWNNSTVTVSFSGADGLGGSGLASCSNPVILAVQGLQTATGTCTDIAGNLSAPASVTVSIDLTPPTVTISSPGNGSSYTYGTVLDAQYGCSDVFSGVASCSSSVASGAAINTQILGSQSLTVTSTNQAGNSSSSSVSFMILLGTPDGLAATAASMSSVQLSWMAGAGAQSYTVYQSTNPSFAGAAAAATGLTTTSTLISGLTPGQTYYFWVESINGLAVSTASAMATITVPEQSGGGSMGIPELVLLGVVLGLKRRRAARGPARNRRAG